ncbi:MFS general substrate transporter [Mycena indigotica]|uniref:MFS general substrate transporter n=1 Tax=Mycena indigotica TaxID=2126181 RepID=A0A8H6S410_9AGAR|nr:MFS general substrate transporter [Mycena indigotica]KAF7291432.1 MFS general substrate transporter [Mycena indigotica]
MAAVAFPEGGARAWATVGGAWCIQFVGFGYMTSFGVYQGASSFLYFYTRDYLSARSPSTIAWIGSVNAFLIVFGGLVSGRLFDRGYFYHLLYGGCVLQCFSLFMLSLCRPQQLHQIFLAQGVGVAVGAGVVYVPSVSVVSHYFQRRRALALTIVASGSSLGAVIHPILLNNLLKTRGFAVAVRASAGLVSGMVLIACLLMRSRLPPPLKSAPLWASVKRLSGDRAFVLATIGMTLFTMGPNFPIFYFQLDAIQHGIDEGLAFYALVIMNSAAVLGRLSPGVLLPQMGQFGIVYLVTGAAFCASILIFAMIALKSVASFVIIGVLYGLCAGLYITLSPPLVAFLTKDMGELGLRMGIFFAVVALGGLVAPPISGALLTGGFRWWRAAVFSGVMAFAGACVFVLLVVAVRRDARSKLDADTDTGGGEKAQEHGLGSLSRPLEVEGP